MLKNATPLNREKNLLKLICNIKFFNQPNKFKI